MTKLPWHAKAKKGLTEFETILYSIDEPPEEDSAVFIDDKRRVRTKPKCNLAISTAPWRDFTILRKPDDSLFAHMAAHAVGYQHSTPRALARNLTCRLDTPVPSGLLDAATEALLSRAKLERYNAEFPESKNPEHTIFPRDARNCSPTRKKDAEQLNAFWDYRELNKSVEPLQSNWMQADNDNFTDPEWEEGDLKKPLRDPEAELETRPNLTELTARWDLPAVQYETRMVSTVDYPRLIEPGYCLTCGKTEMKIPLSGDVWCIGFHKDKLLEHDASARNALPKRGIRRTQKRINDYADRIETPELLNISDVARDRKWTIYQMGSLRFAPYGTERHRRGQVTHYRDNGRWFSAKEDEYGTPYGPESKGSNDNVWTPLHPRTTERVVTLLSPLARAKQLANKPNPIPCLPPTDEELEAFHLKLIVNGKPANDNQQHDGLPSDVESKDELQLGYAFGTSSADEPAEPSDDVAERRQTLTELNARLSPQARLVASMVVQTDETDTLAQNYAEVGAAIATGHRKPSERTLMRHGQQAVSGAAKEIGTLLQELAA
jgi:hypothetical protein